VGKTAPKRYFIKAVLEKAVLEKKFQKCCFRKLLQKLYGMDWGMWIAAAFVNRELFQEQEQVFVETAT